MAKYDKKRTEKIVLDVPACLSKSVKKLVENANNYEIPGKDLVRIFTAFIRSLDDADKFAKTRASHHVLVTDYFSDYEWADLQDRHLINRELEDAEYNAIVIIFNILKEGYYKRTDDAHYVRIKSGIGSARISELFFYFTLYPHSDEDLEYPFISDVAFYDRTRFALKHFNTTFKTNLQIWNRTIVQMKGRGLAIIGRVSDLEKFKPKFAISEVLNEANKSNWNE